MFLKISSIFQLSILVGLATSFVACSPSDGSRKITVEAGFQVRRNAPYNLSEKLSHMMVVSPTPGYCLQDQIYLLVWNDTQKQFVSITPVRLLSSLVAPGTSPTYVNDNGALDGSVSIDNAVAWMSASTIESPLQVTIPGGGDQYEVGIAGNFFNPIDAYVNATNTAGSDGICDQLAGPYAVNSSSLFVHVPAPQGDTVALNIQALHTNPLSNPYNMPGSTGYTAPTLSQNQAADWLQIDGSFLAGLNTMRLKSVSYLNDLIHVQLDNAAGVRTYYLPNVLNPPFTLDFVDIAQNVFRLSTINSNQHCVTAGCNFNSNQMPDAEYVANTGTGVFSLNASDVTLKNPVCSTNVSAPVLSNCSPNVVTLATPSIMLTTMAGGVCTYSISGVPLTSIGATSIAHITYDIEISNPRISGTVNVTATLGSIDSANGVVTGTCPKHQPFLPAHIPNPSNPTLSINTPGLASGSLTGYTSMVLNTIDITGPDPMNMSNCVGTARVTGRPIGTGVVSMSLTYPTVMSGGTVSISISSDVIGAANYTGPCPTAGTTYKITDYH